MLEVDDVDEHHLRALRDVVEHVQQVQSAPLADRHVDGELERRVHRVVPDGDQDGRDVVLRDGVVLGHDGLRCSVWVLPPRSRCGLRAGRAEGPLTSRSDVTTTTPGRHPGARFAGIGATSGPGVPIALPTEHAAR